MSNRGLISRRQRGQGMTEYIIIVALIAIAAIGVYTLFGNVVRGQTSIMASELAGQTAGGAAGAVNTAGQNANTAGQTKANLSNFNTVAESGNK